MSPGKKVAENCLVWPQWDQLHLALWKFDTPENGDAREVRWEWLGRRAPPWRQSGGVANLIERGPDVDHI